MYDIYYRDRSQDRRAELPQPDPGVLRAEQIGGGYPHVLVVVVDHGATATSDRLVPSLYGLAVPALTPAYAWRHVIGCRGCAAEARQDEHERAERLGCTDAADARRRGVTL